MSIDSALKQWAKTPAGKAKLQEAQKDMLKRGSRGHQGTKDPAFYAEKFIEILRAEIALDGFEYGNYLEWTDMGYNDATGKYEIHVNFKDDELHRDSLYQDPDGGYPGGYDNIAALMNRGYSAKDYVYGEYPEGSGQRIRSKKYRQGAHFMQTAVAHFNAQYGANATAELGAEYEGGTINFSF